MIKSQQWIWKPEAGWDTPLEPEYGPQLLLVFGPRRQLQNSQVLSELSRSWPGVPLFGCSTAGQISETQLLEAGIVVTGLRFDRTRVRLAEAALATPEAAQAVGLQLGRELSAANLVHVLVLAEGLAINGSGLVAGLEAGLPPGVRISGGLAGDDGDFNETLICTPTGLHGHHVAAVGLYSSSLQVGCGSCGGWDPFGPERQITRSEGNELFEMDGQPALELYSRYLGDYAAGLPATGLLFPLEVRLPGQEQSLVRTILGINAERGSLIFAGDVPQGAFARLMKTNFEHLLDGAAQAGQYGRSGLSFAPQAALLVSCVGRKMVLKQRCEEELEEVKRVLGPEARLAGFYSYGEIAPGIVPTESELHNQTMTVTVFAEAE